MRPDAALCASGAQRGAAVVDARGCCSSSPRATARHGEPPGEVRQPSMVKGRATFENEIGTKMDSRPGR